MILFDTKILSVHVIPFSQAAAFVERNHRHCKPPIGHKFSLACYNNGKLCGVAIVGRPVSRHFDNGKTLEINRLCTIGTQNACSKLYGACCRYAKKMGYEKVVTYTLASELGTSLKASNFILEAENVGGLSWTGKRKHESTELKNRWVRHLRPANGKAY